MITGFVTFFTIFAVVGAILYGRKLIKTEENDAVFYGEFSNSKINSGLLNREIFLKKIKKNKDPEEIFNCRLDAI